MQTYLISIVPLQQLPDVNGQCNTATILIAACMLQPMQPEFVSGWECHDRCDGPGEKLTDWGVEVVFGLPGDGIKGLMKSLRVRHDNTKFGLCPPHSSGGHAPLSCPIAPAKTRILISEYKIPGRGV